MSPGRLPAAGALLLAIAAALAVAACGGHDPRRTHPARAAPPPAPHPRLPLRVLVGPRLIVGLAGPLPHRALLGAVRRGELGGFIVEARNAPTPAAARRLTRRLQAAARAGGQPRLFVGADQEGGPIRRLPWAPPGDSPPVMGRLGDAAARAEGLAAARALRRAGIGVDFAPVVDVPAANGSLMARDGRAFGASGAAVAARATAFALGLRAGGVQPVLKHFPGLGAATQTTDVVPQTLHGRAEDLAPYRAAISRRATAAVMLSWAVYPGEDPAHPAGRSRAIVDGLLRGRLGFRGVTVTDSLAAGAVKAVTTPQRMAVASARTGVDLLLWGGTGTNWRTAQRRLLGAARAGVIRRPALARSYRRIVAFKALLPR